MMFLLLSTLGNYFPRVWENVGIRQITYFKTCYSGNMVVMQNFKMNFSKEYPQYGFARYCAYNGKNKPYYEAPQRFYPSIICVYDMRINTLTPRKGYDLEIEYSVIEKVTDQHLIRIIENLSTKDLMCNLVQPQLEEILLDFK